MSWNSQLRKFFISLQVMEPKILSKKATMWWFPKLDAILWYHCLIKRFREVKVVSALQKELRLSSHRKSICNFVFQLYRRMLWKLSNWSARFLLLMKFPLSSSKCWYSFSSTRLDCSNGQYFQKFAASYSALFVWFSERFIWGMERDFSWSMASLIW